MGSVNGRDWYMVGRSVMPWVRATGTPLTMTSIWPTEYGTTKRARSSWPESGMGTGFQPQPVPAVAGIGLDSLVDEGGLEVDFLP
jgi:hypothetical protein